MYSCSKLAHASTSPEKPTHFELTVDQVDKIPFTVQHNVNR